MSVEVVTVMNRWPDPVRESYYKPGVFFKSLERFGVKPTVLGLNEEWGGLMTKPRRLRQWLRDGKATADVLICCDAFDVVFVASPDEVGQEYARIWGEPVWAPIVFNAEKGIFPRGELKSRFDKIAGDEKSPWKYLNSGFYIGPPSRVLALLDSMWLDDISNDHKGTNALDGGAGTHVNPNDQGWYQTIFCAQTVPMELDYDAHVCQTLSACTIEEFHLMAGRVQNIVTGTYPLVLHCNGNSKDLLMPTFLKHLGLE